MAKTTSNLLKQAIADAEAVRETAVANAKLVLEEAITPQIRDMIARRLRVESEMGTSDVTQETAKEKPFQDAEAIGGSEFPADSSAIGGSDNKEPSDDAFDTSDVGHGPEAHTDSHTDWYDDWSDSDFDLDEVIKELEEDLNALNSEPIAEAKDDEDEDEDEKKKLDEGEGEEEDEEEGEEEPTMQRPMKREVGVSNPSKFSAPQAPLHPEAVKGGEEEGEEEEEELDLEAILAELEADEDEEGDEMPPKAMHGAKNHDADAQKHAMATKLADLKRELAQYKEAVSHLSNSLHEVKILNAKLLYTNKMFRNQGLTNDQKVRIVESFDRATTVREVKLVYAALVENLSVAAKAINSSRKKVVAEGFASKATPTTAPKKPAVIVENAVAKRLQELAGII